MPINCLPSSIGTPAITPMPACLRRSSNSESSILASKNSLKGLANSGDISLNKFAKFCSASVVRTSDPTAAENVFLATPIALRAVKPVKKAAMPRANWTPPPPFFSIFGIAKLSFPPAVGCMPSNISCTVDCPKSPNEPSGSCVSNTPSLVATGSNPCATPDKVLKISSTVAPLSLSPRSVTRSPEACAPSNAPPTATCLISSPIERSPELSRGFKAPRPSWSRFASLEDTKSSACPDPSGEPTSLKAEALDSRSSKIRASSLFSSSCFFCKKMSADPSSLMINPLPGKVFSAIIDPIHYFVYWYSIAITDFFIRLIRTFHQENSLLFF